MGSSTKDGVDLRNVSLDDKYAQAEGEIFLSGPQAVVRLMMLQKENDRRRGLKTGGFVSGYRGSPLGGVDFALWRASKFLKDNDIRFEPGVNEDLAANAVWGSQQVETFGGSELDGVFGVWYGKNPGLDRCGDVMKHANMDGTSPTGGVLAISGDDPGASSSSIPNQCEQAFIAVNSPVLYPADLEETMILGLKGFEMSRYSGLWTGFKLVADVVESSGTVTIPAILPAPVTPNDLNMPEGGVGNRWPDNRFDAGDRIIDYKLPAVLAFARANGIDADVLTPKKPVLGLVAAGKAYRDTREALSLLGLGSAEIEALGLGLRKPGLIWPIEPVGMSAFARRYSEVLAIEERRSVIEPQLKELAYHWPADRRPRISGKRDPEGLELVPEKTELSPANVARAIADRLLAIGAGPKELLKRIEETAKRISGVPSGSGDVGPPRIPHYCAGCPHARSTRLPEGSFAMAGIGCHSMAMWVPELDTRTISQMGGEGANWIGAAPFCKTEHVFQNMGDGTLYHSGHLAIRAALAAKVPITYKILINNAVAMTGGQPVENEPSPAQIAWQMHGEGIEKIWLLTGNTDHTSADHGPLPASVRLGDRDDLDEAMRDCREYKGVSVILYDQICATEKRRHRKKGDRFQDEPIVVINDRVCEGCGDCSAKSRCIAIRGVDTDFGTKRRIDLSTCNTDLSCMDGFCPSFVTLHGAKPKARAAVEVPASLLSSLPAPEARDPGDLYSIVVVGVGGTGLITIGALIGMAAHLEGRNNAILDNTGLARKGGAVSTHVKIGELADGRLAPRVGKGTADLILAGDLAASAGPDGIGLAGQGARAVVLDDSVPMLFQAMDPAQKLPMDAYRHAVTDRFEDAVDFVNASEIAYAACGDTIFTNMILLGFACQRGFLPVGEAALREAIRLNGIAVERNLSAFDWGRALAADPHGVAKALGLDDGPKQAEEPVEALVDRLAADLERYQNAAYATRYRKTIDRLKAADTGADKALTRTGARVLYRLMAYKDEYEVARLLTDPAFEASLYQRFEGDFTVNYHLAPPFLPSHATRDGRRAKRHFGGWFRSMLKLTGAFKGLRGGFLDLPGRQAERRMERALITEYEAMIADVAGRVGPGSYDAAVAYLGEMEKVRGYGHVKEAALKKVRASLPAKKAAFEAPEKERQNEPA